MSPANDASAGQPMLGRYTLVREIARSNDIVWEATDPQMNRRVAIKELTLPATMVGNAQGERIKRFYREARAAGTMSHPNIVTIHEVSESEGRYFIVMEYLEGRTLRERLASGGSLPLPEVLAITSALCDALEYAHARGVIHRDIKPDNVHLLSDGRVKLTDFGIARITHEDALTMDGQVFGTPSYMSPEQITGKNIDARTDIFSLGILLYEMLTGRKPFTGDSVVTITYRILNDALPSAGPGVPHPLEVVLCRATAKEPEDRYASAGELRAALLAAAGARGGAASGSPMSSSRTLRPGAPVTAGDGVASQATVLGSGQTYSGGAAREAGFPNTLSGTSILPPSVGERLAAIPLPAPVARLLVPLLVLALLLGGAWAISRAIQINTLKVRQNKGWAVYNQAKALYEAGRYEEAARAFESLRTGDVDPQVSEATAGALAYCYLGIGERFFEQGDFTTTERWFRAALSLAPEDKTVRAELARLLKARNAPQGSSPPTGPPTTPGAPSVPPGRVMTPAPGAAPLSGADFQNENARRAAGAARLLEHGNAAWQRGEVPLAVRLWEQAEQTGPGSPAAMNARARLNAYHSGGSFPRL
jgi:tetratricopeptide (TPR) repeat protein